MENKTIVFSNYDDIHNPYYAGGGAVAMHEMAKRLALKNEVIVLTSKYPNSKNEEVDGVFYNRIGFDFFDPRFSQTIFQLILPYYVLKLNFDIWVENLTPPTPFDMLPLFTSKPVVGMVHMLPAKDMERKYHLPFRYFEKFFINRYKYLGTVTESLEEKLKKLNPAAKTYIIQNGIDLDAESETGVADAPDTLLFLGRIEMNQKGLNLLLKSFKKLKNTKNYKLVIAGTGLRSEILKLSRLITELNLENSVQVVGRLDANEKRDYLKKAIALVAPSRFETFGIVALEALALGVPVITFEIDGFSWLPKNTSLKAKPYDVSSLTSKIQTIIDDSKLRESMSKNCIESSKDFTWENSFVNFNRMLLEVLLDSNSGESSSTRLHYGSH